MDEKISITVKILDRSLSFSIDRYDEQKVRAAAKLVDEKAKIYKEKYSAVNESGTQKFDDTDCISLVALQNTVKSLNADAGMMETSLEAAVNEVLDDVDMVLSESK